MMRIWNGLALRKVTMPQSGQIRHLMVVLVGGLMLLCASSAQGQASSQSTVPEIALLHSTGTLSLPSREQPIVFRVVIPPEGKGKTYRIMAVEYTPNAMVLVFTFTKDSKGDPINGSKWPGRQLASSLANEQLILAKELELQLIPQSSFPQGGVPLRFTYRLLDEKSSPIPPDIITTIQVQVSTPPPSEVKSEQKGSGDRAPAGHPSSAPQSPSTADTNDSSSILWALVAVCVVVLVACSVWYYRFNLLAWHPSRRRRFSTVKTIQPQIPTGLPARGVGMPLSHETPVWFATFVTRYQEFVAQMQPLTTLPTRLESMEGTVQSTFPTFLQQLAQELEGERGEFTRELKTLLATQQSSFTASLSNLTDQFTQHVNDAKASMQSMHDTVEAMRTSITDTLQAQEAAMKRLQGTLDSLGHQLAGQERLIAHYQEELDTHSILTRLCSYAEGLSIPIAVQLEDITQVFLQELFGNTTARDSSTDLVSYKETLTNMRHILTTLETSPQMSADVTLTVSRAQKRCGQLLTKLEETTQAVVDQRAEITYTVSGQWREPGRILKEITDSIRHEAGRLHNPQSYFDTQIARFVRHELIAVIDACEGFRQSDRIRGLIERLIQQVGLQDTSPKPEEPFRGKDHDPVQFLPGTKGDVIEWVSQRGFKYKGEEIRRPQVIVRR